MEMIIFSGIQASGKSAFYIQQFFRTHLRISLDMLNTRNKETIFINTCYLTKQRFVVDNTNPTAEDREKYIAKAKRNKYKVIGYYFETDLKSALQRNKSRSGKNKIPDIAIKKTIQKMEVPTYNEGFDELYKVKIARGDFVVEEMKPSNS